MSSYTFDTLNDKDFEELTRDLFQKKFGCHLESFKKGKDGGIDLRCSFNSTSQVQIIQCKHWPKGRIDKLIRHFRDEEFPKARKLNPSKYAIATSLPLSPKNKEDLIKASNGLIKDSSDIFGQEDLNNLINQFPDVEKSHYKLWFSSTNILAGLIHNAVAERSRWTEERIKSKVKKFVSTSKYSDAIKLLNEHSFIIIKGEPGVGKTTLAELIIFDYMKSGFQVITISEKIREAEDLWDSSKKQVFYFDDFLGANYMQLIQEKNSDGALVSFIERVKANKNKKLLLTTRTTILNQAYQNSEKIYRANLDTASHEVRIGNYSELDKARILYNHLFFSDLDEIYFEKIVQDKNYFKIIRHPNFNPRIIEFITTPSNAPENESEKYLPFVLNNLENPSLIWSGAYRNQLNEYEKLILITFFTIDDYVSHDILRAAFQSRLSFEVKTNGFINEPNSFNRYIKSLLGSFLNHTISSTEKYFSLFNPSIGDYLILYLRESEDERLRIFQCAEHLQQLYWRFGCKSKEKIKLTTAENALLKSILADAEREWKTYKVQDLNLEKILAYYELFGTKECHSEIASLFTVLNLEVINSTNWETMLRVVLEGYDCENIIRAVKKRWSSFILRLFEISSDCDKEIFEIIKRLFFYFDVDYENYLELDTNREFVQEKLDAWWAENYEVFIDTSDTIKNGSKPEEIQDEISSLYSEATEFNKEMGVLPSPSMSRISDLNAEEIAVKNVTSAGDYFLEEKEKEPQPKELSMQDQIDDLFDK